MLPVSSILSVYCLSLNLCLPEGHLINLFIPVPISVPVCLSCVIVSSMCSVCLSLMLASVCTEQHRKHHVGYERDPLRKFLTVLQDIKSLRLQLTLRQQTPLQTHRCLPTNIHDWMRSTFIVECCFQSLHLLLLANDSRALFWDGD